ncbi:8885_t:CDS:1, partial [Gigaspora margarita]
KIAPMTPTQLQDLTLTEMNMTLQPNPKVNKQPDMKGLEEKIQESEQDEQNSRGKQTGLKTGNREDIKVTEENNITGISNEEMQIDEKVNQQQDNEYTENEQ